MEDCFFFFLTVVSNGFVASENECITCCYFYCIRKPMYDYFVKDLPLAIYLFFVFLLYHVMFHACVCFL